MYHEHGHVVSAADRRSLFMSRIGPVKRALTAFIIRHIVNGVIITVRPN